MKLTLALTSAILGVALAVPQSAAEKISPTAAAPAGCKDSFSGPFEITVAQVTEKKRSVNVPEKRGACGANGILVMTLKDGVTKDSKDRTGYIASNFQFQFDNPPQAGAIYTSGFSLCQDNLLALGNSKTFYICSSGNFYNLYDRSSSPQCKPVQIIALPCGSGDTATQVPDGQIVATTLVQTTIITALTDGQPQVVTTKVPVPMCQVSDGQVQVHSTPCASITSVAPTSSAVPVSQHSDGQIQVTPPATTSPAGSASATSAPTSAPSATASSSAVAGTSAPAATATAPRPGGSTRPVAGSIGVLTVGLLVAFVCL